MLPDFLTLVEKSGSVLVRTTKGKIMMDHDYENEDYDYAQWMNDHGLNEDDDPSLIMGG